jgi:putative acetyltransferase
MPSNSKATASGSAPILSDESRRPASAHDIQIRAATIRDLDTVRSLFLEYEQFIGTDLCFQNLKKELAELPGKYARPGGALLVAWAGVMAAGCVALRPFETGVCEMKRLFVRAEFQGRGLGRRLADAVIAEAKMIGYREMRLDTLPKLKPAVTLYESLGFVRTNPYRNYENKEIIFMALPIAR